MKFRLTWIVKQLRRLVRHERDDIEQDACTVEPRQHRVVLYTRRDCHLCDDAQAVLTAHGLVFECMDIDRDPMLQAAFDTCVPVVEIDGRIRFRGRVDPVLLRRLLRRRSEGGR